MQGMWEYFYFERLKAKKFCEGVRERTTGRDTQGQWQHESPAKEYMEQVKCWKDTDCTPRMMKQGFFFALKSGEWEQCKSIFKVEAMATEWAFERIREAFEKVAEEEARRLNIVQRIILKSGAPLRQQEGNEVSRCHMCAQNAGVFPWKTTCGGFAICGENYDWRAPNRLLVVHRQRLFKRMRGTARSV